MTLPVWRVGPLGTAHALVPEDSMLVASCNGWHPEEYEARVAPTAETPRCPRCSRLVRHNEPAEPEIAPVDRIRLVKAANPEMNAVEIAERLQTTERKVRYALEGKR